MKFIDRPQVPHGRPARSAVLLLNLGTPDAPTPTAVRRYLREFLSDPRVVELPRMFWLPLLHGVILPVRAKKSAAKYASIWTDEGSPLKVWTEKQTRLLAGYLGTRGLDAEVAYAMRYGSPSIDEVLVRLQSADVDRILLLPLYPQYSATTTAAAFDAVFAVASRLRDMPALRTVKHYHDAPAYIAALADRARAHFEQVGPPERLVLSFHGVPARTLALGDPYHCECLKTARLLREALGLAPSQVVVTFQSRFGKARWLEPYTAPTLQSLAQQGVRRVDVMCPGFVSDCLETLEEIAQEARELFLHAGGKEFHYIDCLNDRPAWIHALADVCMAHGAGWLDRLADRPARQAAAEQTRLAAQAAQSSASP